MPPEVLAIGVQVVAQGVPAAIEVLEDHTAHLVEADPAVVDVQVVGVQVVDEADNNSLLRHSKF